MVLQILASGGLLAPKNHVVAAEHGEEYSGELYPRRREVE